MIKPNLSLPLLLAVCITGIAPTRAEEPPATQATAAEEGPKVITVDREAKVIDLAAKMVPAEPQWLELVATVPGGKGREHEAIVTIDIMPKQLHLALLTLDLMPGHPQINRREGEAIVTDPATGPPLELFFVYEKDGQMIETPVHEWVLDAATGEPLPPCRWMFTGSVFRQWQGNSYYMADEAGNIASLVNFGDDLIVRRTGTTQDTDFQQLQINKEKIPPYGTDLILRIRVPEPAAESAADQPEAGQPENGAPAEPETEEKSDKAPADPASGEP
jgi:hypothetical protein